MESGVIPKKALNDTTNELGQTADVTEEDKGISTCQNLNTEEEHRQITDDGSINVTDNEDSTDPPEISSNKFCIDYSKKGTAKYRKCKKVNR